MILENIKSISFLLDTFGSVKAKSKVLFNSGLNWLFPTVSCLVLSILFLNLFIIKSQILVDNFFLYFFLFFFIFIFIIYTINIS